MAASRILISLVSAFLLTKASSAQSNEYKKGLAEAVPKKISLSEIYSVSVPSLPAASLEARFLCDPGGRIIFRLTAPDTGVGDPLSVSEDGKTVIRFGGEKANDVSKPVLGSTFLSGSDLYALMTGTVPLGYDAKWRKPNGETFRQEASKTTYFVAHFKTDGSYLGATPLDIPYRPFRLGVFEDGNFLIAGVDLAGRDPRLAIVGSNGQLVRSVELNGDIHLQEESSAPVKEDPNALSRGKNPTQIGSARSFFELASLSSIVKDGSNLLLFRPSAGPVFSISRFGEVRVHRLKIAGDYTLLAIKPIQNAWIVELVHAALNSSAAEFATYSFDPDSGVPLRQYVFPQDYGYGLACTDGNEFTFVMADAETKNLRLVKLAPVRMTR